MKWFDRWFYHKCKEAWENKDRFESEGMYNEPKKSRGLNMVGAQAMIERSSAEGQDRISFELTSAVGGRILNVRRYQDKLDRHENQTYVIPSGEDVGARVAKIINLELLK